MRKRTGEKRKEKKTTFENSTPVQIIGQLHTEQFEGHNRNILRVAEKKKKEMIKT